MKTICREIRDTLATEGPRALQDNAGARQHLAECDDCFAFLERLSEIETDLRALPRPDAPDEIVEALLARPEIAEPTARGRSLGQRVAAGLANAMRPRTLAWGSVATALLLVMVAVGLRFELPRQQSGDLSHPPEEAPMLYKIGGEGKLEHLSAPGKDEQEVTGKEVEEREAGPTIDLDKLDASRWTEEYDQDLPVPHRSYEGELTMAPGVQDAPPDGSVNVHGSRTRDLNERAGVGRGADASNETAPGRVDAGSIDEMEAISSGAGVEFGRAQGGFADAEENGEPQFPREPLPDPAPARKRYQRPPPPPPPPPRQKPSGVPLSTPLIAGVAGVTPPVPIEESRVRPEYPETARSARLETRVVLQLVVRTDGTVGDVTVLSCDHPGMGFEAAAVEAVRQWRYRPAESEGEPVEVYWTVSVDFGSDDPPADSGLVLPPHDDAVRAARDFLAARASFEDAEFRSPTGYWSNRYVPGDPLTRLLRSRLAHWDPSALLRQVPSEPRLHEAARRVGQPFDSPDASALAVYLQADRRGVAGERRMLLQVGLEGTPRRGGRRPAMNLALVLDLRDQVPDDVTQGVRALLDAFNRARRPGDRFRVILAGRPGGVVVESRQFRHGFLKVMLDRLGAGEVGNGPELGLVEAVSQAITTVAAGDDADAPLGTSAVILITGQPLGEATRSIAGLAHGGAVAGVSLSVIGIGSRVESSEIDRVALAGQGNRRLLDAPAGARDLVDRELSAVTRAVARAVRLRIRLSPGVRLIDVLGSERLDDDRARRVRAAERSIDLRLARNLGIEADRGDDEDGIQIVIPAFYAGDSHVILLDVVTPGPGPVADVTVRYKDLVHLRNGVARAGLDLRRDERPAGPLERNVLKNLLSFRLSRTLDEAGRSVAAGDADRAGRLLRGLAELLDGLRREVPGLDHDPEVERDLAMLDEYRALLATGVAGRSEHRAFIADSLRLAARLKVQPRPLETTS